MHAGREREGLSPLFSPFLFRSAVPRKHARDAAAEPISPSTSHRRAVRTYGCCRCIVRRLGERGSSPFLTFPASTVGVSARTRRRSVGFRRGLIRWIQDFERNPRSPYLPDFVEVRLVESVLYLTAANFGTETLESLFELDKDTLHTRLGSSHECHSGGGRGAFALVSLRLVGLAIHGLVSVEVAIQSQLSRDGCVHSPRDGATGFGYCAFRGSGSRQGRREVEPYPTDRARGTPLLQVLLTLRIQGKFLVYGGFVGVPGERDIRGVTSNDGKLGSTKCFVLL
uniref:Uncharacterized protein n=1 Tax=Ananas comosus var. bracteatus TaxID=296719 RepID=A0A6V7PQ33_ANACO|nr:unnamed protein product [Ananas comosus var. bracteatus]